MLRTEDGHVLRTVAWSRAEDRGWSRAERALDFEAESERKKGRLKRTQKNQAEEESIRDCYSMEDTVC